MNNNFYTEMLKNQISKSVDSIFCFCGRKMKEEVSLKEEIRSTLEYIISEYDVSTDDIVVDRDVIKIKNYQQYGIEDGSIKVEPDYTKTIRTEMFLIDWYISNKIAFCSEECALEFRDVLREITGQDIYLCPGTTMDPGMHMYINDIRIHKSEFDDLIDRIVGHAKQDRIVNLTKYNINLFNENGSPMMIIKSHWIAKLIPDEPKIIKTGSIDYHGSEINEYMYDDEEVSKIEQLFESLCPEDGTMYIVLPTIKRIVGRKDFVIPHIVVKEEKSFCCGFLKC